LDLFPLAPHDRSRLDLDRRSQGSARQEDEMKKWLRVLLWIVAVVTVVALGVVVFVVKTPADYDLPYEDVTVTTADGVELPG
jgi:hypothetical protein